MRITKYGHACVRIEQDGRVLVVDPGVWSGYLVDDRVYHPGDSLHVPQQPVETLLVPAQASWLKLAEAIDFVQAIRPERSFAIHDAQVNERGPASVNGWLAQETDGYRYLAPGESL